MRNSDTGGRTWAPRVRWAGGGGPRHRVLLCGTAQTCEVTDNPVASSDHRPLVDIVTFG